MTFMKSAENTLGERLRLSRKKAGYTQKEAADKLGITQASISDIESGEIQRTKYIIRFSQLYKVDPVWLSEGIGEQENIDQPIFDQANKMPKRAKTDNEILRCFDVMVELRPHLKRDDFIMAVRSMKKDGYSLAFMRSKTEHHGFTRG